MVVVVLLSLLIALAVVSYLGIGVADSRDPDVSLARRDPRRRCAPEGRPAGTLRTSRTR